MTEATTAPRYVNLRPGDPAPWAHQRSTGHPNFRFETAAGRYIVLCFHATAADAAGRGMIDAALRERDLFDDEHMSFFGVSLDPGDEREGRVRESIPGIRYFLDFDGSFGRSFGAVPLEPAADSAVQAMRFWLVLDPNLRVVARFAGDTSPGIIFSFLRDLPPVGRYAGFEIPAPILILPKVFEPEFCRALVDVYEREGGEESGFMREVGGRTVVAHNPSHKRRRDCTISDPALINEIQARMRRRIVPELKKVYAFDATRMERYIVGCYDSEEKAHFRAHRDNTTKGTAHRRFAVSINLNEEFEGGSIAFPEFSPRRYKAPTGTAVIFPCALMHEVAEVTHGRRYAFLPFLYDEAAARIREENAAFVDTADPAGASQPARAAQ